MTNESRKDCVPNDEQMMGRRCCGRKGAGGGHGMLVEPAALAALLAGGSHGYDMQRLILELTDGQVDADPGGLYRALRRLEADGYVASAWGEEGSGPRRREYELTAEGYLLAQHWISHLRERERLAGLLAGLLENGLAESDALSAQRTEVS